jgi:hypothetical protein
MVTRMTSSPKSLLARPWRIGARAACVSGLVTAALLACAPAQAQYYNWGDGSYFGDGDYPEPGPHDYPGPRDYLEPGPRAGYLGPGGYRDEPSSPRPRLSLTDIRQRAEQRGLHLIATPRRKGRIYLAAAEDGRGVRHRLVFDAYEGQLLENTIIGSKGPSTERTEPTHPRQ